MNLTSGDCRYIELPKRSDDRGSMTYLESQDHIPFRIRSIRRIQAVPGLPQISLAFRNGQSVWIVLQGRLDVEADDGKTIKNFTLERPNHALYVPPGVWLQTSEPKALVIGLVIHSEELIDQDEIRTYEFFKKYRNIK